MDKRNAPLRHPDFMRQAFLWSLLPLLVLVLSAPSVGDAQVVTNITSSGLNTQISQVGNSYNITEGTRPGCPGACGPNLFHSFGQFDVGRTAGVNDIANFVNLMNGVSYPTTNILARVTGTANNPSSIFGTILTNGTTGFGNANLFLVNPSGFVFGPNGSVNVGGSVSFTTAQYLRLFDEVTGNSANFYANPDNDSLTNSVLAVAPVVEFGFLSPAAYGFLTPPSPNATITVQGSALAVPSGQSISLVGGNISIQAGTLENGTTQAATLSAPGGRINLASVASAGEVLYPSLQFGPNVIGGSIALSQGTTLDVSGSGNVGSGVVVIRGGQLMIDQSSIIANTVDGNGANPGINIQVSQDLSLTNGAIIASSTSGAGRGGDVAIVAGTVQMDGASITSATTGSGRGGDISITEGQTVNLINGAQIVSRTDGLGDGGNITVSATDTVSISGFDTTGTLSGVPLFGIVMSGVISTASAGGNGGQISITAPHVTMDNLGTLATINTGSGTLDQDGQLIPQVGGAISINATTVGLTNGASVLSSTGFDLNTFTNVGSGNGGNVTVQGLPRAADNAADSVTLSGAQITTQTLGPGQGGKIDITSDAVQLDTVASINSVTFNEIAGGASGSISLNVNTLTLMDSSFITTAGLTLSPGFGQIGNVTIRGLKGGDSAAELVTLSGGSGLTSQTFGIAEGGRLSITSESLAIDGSSFIGASTSWTGGGGDIVVSVREASLSDGGAIQTGTDLAFSDAGVAGTITLQGLPVPGKSVTKADSLTLAGQGSGIFSSSAGTGDLGDIEVHAKTVSLTNNAAIQVGTQEDAAATAGNVIIDADSVGISGGSRIASQVFAAEAGQVRITADQLTLNNGEIQTSTNGIGQAGAVVLNVGSISMTNSSRISSASTRTDPVINFVDGTSKVPGRAGNITITATSGFTSDASSIATSAEANHGGDISITADSVQLSNGAVINASTNGPAQVTRLVLDENGNLVEQVVGDGGAGKISITTTGNPGDIVSLAGGSTIASVTTAGGDAGQVILSTPTLNVDNATITTNTSSSGNAGSITAKVGTLTLTNGAEISSNSTGEATGAAGSVTINASGSFTSNGSKVSTSAENAKGGDILIDAQNVQLSNGTLISASSNAPLLLDGAGNAGNITINSDSNVVMQNSKVTTEASNASGGDITINANAAEMVQLVNSRVSTSVGGSVGVPGASDGGNITIDPQFVILQNSQIIAQANAGAGGAIKIVAGSAYIKDPASIVDASSTLGISGPVIIESPVKNVGGQLTPLSQQFSSAAALLAQQCAARVADGKFSTFVVAGREGLPVEPGGFLASPSLTAELLGASLSGLYPHRPIPAVTGSFSEYDAGPIQLAKYGDACR